MTEPFRTYSDALKWKLDQTDGELSDLEEQWKDLRLKIRRLRVEKQMLARLLEQEQSEEALHEMASLETGFAPPWDELAYSLKLGPPPDPSVGDVILTYMSSSPTQVWRVKELEQQLDIDGWNFKRSAIRTAVSRLKEKGELEQVGRGRYRHTGPKDEGRT